MVARLPAVVDRLLAGIPRLEGVCRIIRQHLTTPLPPTADDRARVLRIAADAVDMELRGEPAHVIAGALHGRYGRACDAVVDAVAPAGGPSAWAAVRDIPIDELVADMVLVVDIRSGDGRLVVGRGQVVTPGLIEGLEKFRRHNAVTGQVTARVSDGADVVAVPPPATAGTVPDEPVGHQALLATGGRRVPPQQTT